MPSGLCARRHARPPSHKRNRARGRPGGSTAQRRRAANGRARLVAVPGVGPAVPSTAAGPIDSHGIPEHVVVEYGARSGDRGGGEVVRLAGSFVERVVELEAAHHGCGSITEMSPDSNET